MILCRMNTLCVFVYCVFEQIRFIAISTFSMKNFIVSAVLLLSVFLQGCATILGKFHDKTLVKTNADNAVVYVDDKEVGKGRNVTITAKRDMKTKIVRVEKDGYKPVQIVYRQLKRPPIFMLSIPLLVVAAYDNGKRSFMYPKELNVSHEFKIRKKMEKEKYIFTTKSSFNVDPKNFVLRRYSNKRKFEKGKIFLEKVSDESIKLDNSIFTDQLNKLLYDNNFIDTTGNILKTKTNTLYIRCVVSKLVINEIASGREGVYSFYGYNSTMTTDLSVEWQVLDVYEQIKYKKSMTVSSDEFVTNDDVIKECVNDALTKSFFQLLQESEVQKLLPLENRVVKYDVPVSLDKPLKTPTTFEESMESAVTIRTKDGHGSGMIVSRDGYILTNFHVISGSDESEVILNNGEKLKAKLVRKNEINDIALLKVEKTFERAFQIPSSKNFNLGQEIYAIGTPTSIELGQTITKGIISGVRKFEYGEMIQTDVSINFGNSGGPLINKQGEFLGVVNSKLVGVGVEGVAFCIPAYKIFELLGINY